MKERYKYHPISKKGIRCEEVIWVFEKTDLINEKKNVGGIY